MMVAYVVMAIGYLVVAVIGQRLGRRKTLLGLGVVIAIVTSLAFFAMVRTLEARGSSTQMFVFVTIAIVVGISPFGLAHTYVIERFPTAVRASGYGIGYSTAIIIPSFYSLFMLGLGKIMPYAYTPIVLIVLGSALTIAAVSIGSDHDELDITGVGCPTVPGLPDA